MERYRYNDAELALIEQASVPMAVYQFIDRRVVTLALSDGFCRLLGYAREEAYRLMDADMYRDTHPDDVARIADAAFRFATEGGCYDAVYRSKVGDSYRIIHARGEHKLTKTGVRIAVVWYQDEGVYRAEELQKAPDDRLNLSFSTALHKESMYQNSYYDMLTGLPNMSFFFTLAQEGIARLKQQRRKTAVLYFDLNGMKYYNSQHGFAAGDRLIAGFARLLAQRFSNENCGRFSADQFAVFTEERGLEQILQQIFAELGELTGGSDMSVRVGIYPDRMGAVEISAACDRAKYACDTCRSFVSDWRYFDEKMLESVQKQRYIINNLDRAIRERWIDVHYQPIVRASNGRVCNEEALCRWIDPERGALAPSEVIPVLEESRLIYKLDLYVLDRILEKLREQKTYGLHVVPQSLNLSREDFAACDVVEEVRRRVDEAGIPRDRISIELTESVIGGDFDFMKEQIRRFRELGFCVWMDDFGSGYSSLDVLQSIRFDLIKFDMRFMQQFSAGNNSKIILTELVRMASALGIETVAEGVETEEQVTFLREIGCTKLQGFYYCRAVPLPEIVERYRKGVQIGFENPAETDYYAAIGRVNLYDLGIVSKESADPMDRFLDTMPMAIVEIGDENFRILQGNRSYRARLEKVFRYLHVGEQVPFSVLETGPGPGAAFARAMRDCGEEGRRIFFDEELPDGSTVHAFIRNVAVNPVRAVYACAIVVLGVTDAQDRRMTYTAVARALSSDYIFLYYVNIETDRFIEYSTAPGREELSVERHGADFFGSSYRDAQTALFKDDVALFTASFTKEKLLRAIDRDGTFTLSYRLLLDGKPQYVNMKALRIGNDEKHVIIGVSNVDAQMRRKEADERAAQDRIIFGRISALAGRYLCIYMIDPETDRYTVYSEAPEFAALGVAEQGDFFAESRRNCDRLVYPDDRERFRAMITKESILGQIRDGGMFVTQHRQLVDGKWRYVRVKAALVREPSGEKIILGINDIDAQINRV